MTSPSRISERLRYSLLALGAVGIVSCGGESSDKASGDTSRDAGTMSWVGQLPESDVRASLVFGDGVGALFFCGGDSTFRERTRWFRGAMNRGEPVVIERPDGWRVSFNLGDGPIAGILASPSGEETAWSLAPVERATIAGLYEGTGACGLLGLIVEQPFPEATPMGQGACVADDPITIEQVNPIEPLELTDERKIRVELVGSAEQYHLARSVPHL